MTSVTVGTIVRLIRMTCGLQLAFCLLYCLVKASLAPATCIEGVFLAAGEPASASLKFVLSLPIGGQTSCNRAVIDGVPLDRKGRGNRCSIASCYV